MVLGLAGKSCSGKNRMGEFLEGKGAIHMDLDRTAHVLLDKYAAEIEKIFGKDFRSESGGTDRAVLSAYVFSDSERLAVLEGFLYPKIEEEVKSVMAQNPYSLIIVNGAALHKSGIVDIIDGLIWMDSPFWLRLARASRRDKRSLGNLLKRFRSQREFRPQQFPSHVDIYKVYNGLSSTGLVRRAEKMYRRWIMRGERK